MTGAAEPLVEMVIAIHDASRPLERAVQSLLAGGLVANDQLRITVVCHNVPMAEIESSLSSRARQSVHLLELNDGIPSAAGPFNHGIQQATARYVAIMGSDDYLDPGALKAWVDFAERESLVALIAPQRHAAGGRIRTPPVRPFRTRGLNGVKDRLVYRTAPLGLIRREAVARLGLSFPEGLRTGEDQFFSAGLWFAGEPIGYGRGLPDYVVGDDAKTRVSLGNRPLEDELRFVDELIAGDWFAGLTTRQRRALATKMVRVHVFGVVSRRGDGAAWTADDLPYLRRLVGRLRTRATGFERSLAIADRRLLDALADPLATLERVDGRARERRRFGRPATLITRDPRGLLASDGPLRYFIASALL